MVGASNTVLEEGDNGLGFYYAFLRFGLVFTSQL